MCGHSDRVGRSAIAASRRLYSSTSRSYVRCRSPRGRDTWSGSVGTRRSRHCSVNRMCGIGLPPDCACALTGPQDVSNRSGSRDYSHQGTEHTLRAITSYQHRSFRPWSRPRLLSSKLSSNLEAEIERSAVCLQAVAGPRFEPTTWEHRAPAGKGIQSRVRFP